MTVTARKHFLNSFINEAKDGKIFTVDFVKKNGEIRTMNARHGVRKGTTGKGLKYKPTPRRLLPVFHMQLRELRMISFDTNIYYSISVRKSESIHSSN